MPYIYKITNLINQNAYIGKTEKPNPYERWHEHVRESKMDRSQSRALYRAIQKYGLSNFEFKLIEETDDPNNREIYYIDYYDTYAHGYNETLGGDGKSYICFDEKSVCEFYLSRKSIAAAATKFQCDRETIKKILIKNGVQIIQSCNLSKDIQAKRVARVDLITGEVLEVFDRIADANRKYGAAKHISAVCKNKRKSCCGFGWKYIE